jgi:hypothetical protein
MTELEQSLLQEIREMRQEMRSALIEVDQKIKQIQKERLVDNATSRALVFESTEHLADLVTHTVSTRKVFFPVYPRTSRKEPMHIDLKFSS